MTTATGLTLGGLVIALVILIANLRPWWKGGRDPKQLVPFSYGLALGSVSTICMGGLLGWLAGCTAGVGNRVGDKGVGMVTGSRGSSTLARGDLGHLTPEGAIVVVLLTAIVFLAWRSAGKQDKKRIFGGAYCGATLCLTAGVAGLLAFLPDAINMIGAQGRAAIEGGIL